MSDDFERIDPSKLPAKIKKLVEYLSALNTRKGEDIQMEIDMLSLIVSGTLNGENIAERYPAFHKKLLENSELRQSFIDALESVEAERTGTQASMPEPSIARLDFLKREPAPLVELFDQKKWRATWLRTLEQLQAIFSPSEMIYRADPALSEDPWFTLLREEVTVDGNTYDVILDCTLASENESALAVYLNLAVTLDKPQETPGFPLRASLHWGDYQESVLLNDEGRVKFPDIPTASVFEEADFQLQAGFDLTIETAS